MTRIKEKKRVPTTSSCHEAEPARSAYRESYRQSQEEQITGHKIVRAEPPPSGPHIKTTTAGRWLAQGAAGVVSIK